jgi:FKBP-type peptidyl-prolyl cis-trans isomerase FkpA/FKBP-type peptidyl-prolyl cis-trans isomerase FklB
MPVGSKYQVFIPADLAYGPRPNPEIGPNATLIFDIELVSIKPKPAAATAPPATNPANSAPAPEAAKPADSAKPAEPAK